MKKADLILILGILGITFIILILKLTIFSFLSWWIVFLPILVPILFILLLFANILLGLIFEKDDNVKKR